MSSEKRVILFTVVTFASILAVDYLMRATGIIPPPPPARPQANALAKGAAPAPGKEKDATASKPASKPAETPQAKSESAPPRPSSEPAETRAAVALAKADELVLGSATDVSPDGYHLQVVLDQRGGTVSSVASSRFEAEFEEGKPRNRPLQVLARDPLAPPSLSITLQTPRPASTEEAKAAGVLEPGEFPLDRLVWEVVRDEQGRAVQPITRPGSAGLPGGKATVEGQQLVFRTKIDEIPGLSLTRTYRLFKGADSFETDLSLSSPDATHKLSYRILGPHGIPIEGEWYTGTFREAVFGQVNGAETKVATLAAYDIVKAKDHPERFQTLPLKYAGVENQYFASLIKPVPTPQSDTDRWDSESQAIVLHENPESAQKTDIGVEISTRPLVVGPNANVTHTYHIFAGPKTIEALTAFGAEDLASYRKSNWIPFAPFFARAIITPLLSITYELTRQVAALFGKTRGNYGVAIILLTLIVRLAMFPLGRKAAMAAKKMQDLQPYLKEIQEKYKDDKEAQTRETFALYKRHGVNPVGGCLPALIQLPIFVGLWQALNNSVSLRHAGFLWIDNLAAPDMMFKFPVTVWGLGDYFNLLPFLVVALMLVQTKLFSPPATTPEAEMQQKMMKYMMVFMAFMFYKVPSGLGIYFITSSLWQIGERLLLPKVSHAPAVADGGTAAAPEKPKKPPGRIAQFFEKVMEEAAKDPTYRKLVDEREDGKGREGDSSSRDRDKGGKPPRARPGKRR